MRASFSPDFKDIIDSHFHTQSMLQRGMDVFSIYDGLFESGFAGGIDIGCGPGAFLCAVHEQFPGIRLGALDLSEEMIKETAERLGSSVNAVAGDAEDMPLKSGSYDIVTCNMSLHHHPHPVKSLGEMHRILTGGGYLLLNDMDCVAPIRGAANIVFPLLDTGDVKMYSRDEIISMMETAGFRDIFYRKISPFTFQCIGRKG